MAAKRNLPGSGKFYKKRIGRTRATPLEQTCDYRPHTITTNISVALSLCRVRFRGQVLQHLEELLRLPHKEAHVR
jgi:hypothetical protein